jgi:hypothetical protein
LKGSVVYSEFDRIKSNTNLTINDFPPSQVLYIGMDANVGRMAAVVGFKNEQNQLFVVNEHHHIMDTPSMIETIKQAYPNRTIVITPDSSMGSRKSMDASKSDIRLLREAGFRIKARRKNPAVRDRVVSVNASFRNANKERNLFINVDKCPNLTEQLEKQVYDEASGAPVKDGTEDPLDALGYLVINLRGLSKPSQTTTRMRMV